MDRRSEILNNVTARRRTVSRSPRAASQVIVRRSALEGLPELRRAFLSTDSSRLRTRAGLVTELEFGDGSDAYVIASRADDGAERARARSSTHTVEPLLAEARSILNRDDGSLSGLPMTRGSGRAAIEPGASEGALDPTCRRGDPRRLRAIVRGVGRRARIRISAMLLGCQDTDHEPASAYLGHGFDPAASGRMVQT